MNYGRILHALRGELTRTQQGSSLYGYDLQRFYEKGYQLIRMDEFLENRIRVGKGKTPLILTFDDSSPGQLRFLPDGKFESTVMHFVRMRETQQNSL